MATLQWLGLVGVFLLSTGTALHALLEKREPPAAFAWIAVCLLFPVLGPILYFFLGVNRIRTRARKLVGGLGSSDDGSPAHPPVEIPTAFRQQARISAAVTGLPLTAGNTVEALPGGDSAYPRMLAAIDAANERVYLSTYIFESNTSGERFADALARAHQRGVDVRVLLDGAGEWYSWPRIRHRLRRSGIHVARFLPPRLLPPSLLINLRNHRKLLLVDGGVAFTGGMNIGDRHLRERPDGTPGIRDVHFRIDGPITSQLETVFLDDWEFASGARDAPNAVEPPADGDALCRVIVDGPNEDLHRLTMVLVGAVAAAREQVAIMTPYFLPPRELISALQAAAVRGVTVDVLLPARNNLPFMHWATRNMLWELVKWGVRVYYQPGPFDHSKLFVVDRHYAQVGSANLDPRSLRLNFEAVVEIYDTTFGASVASHIEHARQGAAPVTLEELDNRPLLPRIRDAVCWLFTPYL
ncbi:phospholipase D-like domain-containing protein [Spiribacter halobius]|uniref:Cardiolipin synthase n=1 Tax=Sediminicurvatus halobius TaxID=2182432 RepID=A0A2U2N6I6_9GAMM|nr:phospholipase D-like domain-containing protein [Spiribacter halobius]PWG64579.1 cardiolipin synthase [Spiribacter halobius]UEX79101.1 phospholipase D-like domain-containing protein [Spiribacter halobius]